MILSVEHIGEILLTYRYFLLVPIAILEGPLVTLLAGFFVAQGYMDFRLTYLLIIISDEIGDALHYLVGIWGGHRFIKRFGHYVGITDKEVRWAEELFKKRGGITVMLSKLAHGIGGVFQIAAGLVRMPFWRFLGYTSIMTLFKGLGLMLLGYYFGQKITTINSYLDIFALVSLSLVIIFGLYMAYRSTLIKKELEETN